MDSLCYESVHQEDTETVEQRDSVRIIRINWDKVRSRQNADRLKRIGVQP